jgi:hypothetical protein
MTFLQVSSDLTQFRRQVFESFHNLSHSGIRATKKLLRTKFILPSINKDSVLWTRTCIQCQKSKIGKHKKSSEHTSNAKRTFQDGAHRHRRSPSLFKRIQIPSNVY